MSIRMLIDARHTEETRVTVVKGSRVEEFDYEATARRQLKGNIYLARVTRVEPSLQAAFVEYGGNRHGFLAFSEIHPDYYQIPVEDREALMAAEAEAAAESDDDPVDGDETAAAAPKSGADGEDPDVNGPDANGDDMDEAEAVSDGGDAAEAERDDEVAAAAARRRGLRELKRRYNIQEVIRKRQVLLVQVVKEERGNKGAALTTYLSLAGRYCVLMPNSTNGGGISRKISSPADRKRLKTIISSLNLAEDMGLIVRTAGLQRTKAEIKRDYEYLLRLWNGIRELTLKSVAPALIYEEADLIRRTIRDLYSRDVDEILVEGEAGYRSAKDFMKMLMPSHAKKVQHYKDRIPLFHRYQVESQLDSMYHPVVQLRSGGYVVINPTEALISIDVNSGRATKEHNIEGTALKTNLEAAEEIARQLRLRDMAGLVVIDFIDMEERGNNRAVEKRMKDVLKSDRARIQVGRISSFGLMEMSRQRLRPNLMEVSTEPCQHCNGTGFVRSVDFASLSALRQIEEEGIRGRSASIAVHVHPDVAIYLLNKKRALLLELEERYDFRVDIVASSTISQSDIEITREARVGGARTEESSEAIVTPEGMQEATGAALAQADPQDDEKPKRKRRRRRRKKSGEDMTDTGQTQAESGSETASPPRSGETDEDDKTASESNRRRRGRRGGRRRRNRTGDETIAQDTTDTVSDTVTAEAPSETMPADTADAHTDVPHTDEADTDAETKSETQPDSKAAEGEGDKPKPRRSRTRKKPAEPEGKTADAADADGATEPETASQALESQGDTGIKSPAEDAPAKPRRRRTRKKTEAEEAPVQDEADVQSSDSAPSSESGEKPSEDKPKRSRRKPAKAKTAAAAETAGAENTAATAEKSATEPAKPARRPRKTAPKPKKADKDTDTADKTSPAPATQTAPVPAGRDTAAPKPAAADIPAPTPVADAPVEAEGGGKPTDTNPQPKKRGWWQRTFG
ncbi:Rne/Rng family ribonuclease [Eilatimonas milleporae]|uniref:Ribonuclease E n=1 Tax=Eilatimonas milleporae TaxID=911205 RepID=A0A3M0CIF0_9PROT|nr:ribonuclease E/G [Eilatimonas milleporae]RMB08557.1 RNAse E [Eilatimonas milleporae]